VAKCLYVGTKCLLETKGKCGKAVKCPYAQQLMTEVRVKNLDDYYTRFIQLRGPIEVEDSNQATKG
jgi:hypothetical protein